MKHILVIFASSLSLLLNAQSRKEHQVAAAIEQLRNAMISGNAKDLENIVSDQLNYGHSSGAIDDKKIFVEKLTSGKSDFVTINISEQTISVSNKIAIVRHKLEAKTNDNGKAGELKLNVLLVWKKLGGRWKLLARQAVKHT